MRLRDGIHATWGLALVLSGCVGTGGGGSGAPLNCAGTDLTTVHSAAVPALSTEVIADGLDQPVAMAFAPDGRLFFTEKATGRVRVVTADGQLLDDPFVDLPVNSAAERGLLGIALHPDFAQNGFLYVYYSRSNTGQDNDNVLGAQDNRVVRFTARGNVAADDETPIISLPVAVASRHNGGNIHFGPDGKLYITIGDLFDSSNSQKLAALPGRILRLNDDGSTPADNPFGADNPTFALGLRNSFDFTFDPVSGALFATENGTNIHDEINRLLPGSNGGWPTVEGCSDGAPDVAAGTYAQPLVESVGSVVPTGIAFIPDATYGADNQNQLLVCENGTGRIFRYTLNAARDAVSAAAVFKTVTGAPTDLEFGPDGILYVTDISAGRIIRLAPQP